MTSISSGKRRREKAINKTIRSGIKTGTKELKQALRIGKNRTSLSEYYMNHFSYEFRFTKDEEDAIKSKVENHFKENTTYSVERQISHNIYGQPIGWYNVIIIEE